MPPETPVSAAPAPASDDGSDDNGEDSGSTPLTYQHHDTSANAQQGIQEHGRIDTVNARQPARGRRKGSTWSSLWLLTRRDLKVRYSTSILGYLWSVLDPLLMSLIYWFVFTQVFDRHVGEKPYIVFLLAALLPWMWLNGAVSDSTRAFLRDIRLVRSINLPRWIWVGRIVATKGVEFILSLPVLALFAIFSGAEITWRILLLPLGIILLAALTLGIGLIIAPLVVFFRDLERATKLVLRVLFYASPIIYAPSNLPEVAQPLAWFNPLSGIFGLFRSGFFPSQLHWGHVGVAAIECVLLLIIGFAVFRRSIGAVLKEL